jgi:hypothetical protein
MSDNEEPFKKEAIDFSSPQFERNRDKIRKGLLSIRDALTKESVETREMIEIYYRFTQGKASKEELKKAEDQLQDVVKAMGLSFFGIMPFAPLTIPMIVKLGEKLGIDVLPSAFRDRAPKPEEE